MLHLVRADGLGKYIHVTLRTIKADHNSSQQHRVFEHEVPDLVHLNMIGCLFYK